jgi:PiT family inorganic phosphate transporter
MTFALLGLVALLAFANGANDNCKGVATLVGYGAATPRRAMMYATITTLIGAIVSFWFSGGLIKSFSTGLFVKGAALDGAFFIAVLIGAIAWVLFATFTGLPVSTTHAITGALTGAGLVALGNAQFQWSFLGTKFAVPLAISPLLSMALVYAIAWPVAIALRRAANRCVCVVSREPAMVGATVVATSSTPLLIVDDESNCQAAPVAVTTSATANAVHWFSGGFVGFARGWNDAPKIAALGLVAMAGPHGMAISFAIVAVAMAIGGLVAGLRVLETLANKVTPLPLAQSVTASMTTATLVGLASWAGLPVSTTHVATGAIIGAGLQNDRKSVRWGKVAEIVLSWVITLPVAALVAAGAALVMRRV